VQINELLSEGKLSARLPVPSKKVLIATVAVAFLLLHVLAGMAVLRAAADGIMTPQEQARASLYD
jgi:hypothetical protein